MWGFYGHPRDHLHRRAWLLEETWENKPTTCHDTSVMISTIRVNKKFIISFWFSFLDETQLFTELQVHVQHCSINQVEEWKHKTGVTLYSPHCQQFQSLCASSLFVTFLFLTILSVGLSHKVTGPYWRSTSLKLYCKIPFLTTSDWLKSQTPAVWSQLSTL